MLTDSTSDSVNSWFRHFIACRGARQSVATASSRISRAGVERTFNAVLSITKRAKKGGFEG